MRTISIILFSMIFIASCNNITKEDKQLSKEILNNKDFIIVKQKAKDLLSIGFSAGAGYGEIWIRDFNTFMDLAIDVNENELIKEKLLIFFDFQGDDGNIVDGYILKEKIMKGVYDYRYSNLAPNYAAHKNTVETDQESSLIQGVYKYVKKSGDKDLLDVEIGGKTVAERMEFALDYLLKNRYNKEYGLIFGATTADWGDVQPENIKGVIIDEETHFAIDIYDNAMMVIAIKNFIEIVPSEKKKWNPILKDIKKNIRKYLWDKENMKFRPHVYIEGSPFPKKFNENEVFYMGGTAVAIEAGLLNKEEVKISLTKMIENMNIVGAGTIGLSVYPAYPDEYFKHPILTKAYTYQNGGDWTWFGGRMIQQLVNFGFYKEANEQLKPFNDRIIKNNGFYEWYSIKNEPKGSASYRGSAGVIYKSIIMLEDWAKTNN